MHISYGLPEDGSCKLAHDLPVTEALLYMECATENANKSEISFKEKSCRLTWMFTKYCHVTPLRCAIVHAK